VLLTLALDGDEWLALRPGRVTPWERTPPRNPISRRLGGPQGQSGRGGEEKNSCPCWESNPGRPARSLVTILCFTSFCSCSTLAAWMGIQSHVRSRTVSASRMYEVLVFHLAYSILITGTPSVNDGMNGPSGVHLIYT